MRLTDFAILADENINPLLVKFLLNNGFDIIHVNDVGLGNTADHLILAYAHEQRRVVLTLDDDFGTLVFKEKQPFVGIIRLRPGHLTGTTHYATVKALLIADINYEPPFVVTAEKRNDHIHLRYRTYSN